MCKRNQSTDTMSCITTTTMTTTLTKLHVNDFNIIAIETHTTERGTARSDGVLQRHVAQRRFPASHVERPCRHDQDEQRCRGMAQPGEQSHRLLPSERLQTGDGSEGGTGDYRAHTPTRRHWCATTSTTTEIPGP